MLSAQKTGGKTMVSWSMIQVDPSPLRQAVEGRHGGKAVLVDALLVKELFEGETAWEGVVLVFGLEGHPKATRDERRSAS